MHIAPRYPSQIDRHGNVPPPSDRAQQYATFRKMVKSRYETMPPWRAPWERPWETLSNLSRILVAPKFQNDVVDAPYHIRLDERPERDKLFHRLGSCATCDFVPAPDSPFTGILSQRAPGVVRLSLATSPALYAPGMAIKLFRSNGEPSVNLLAAPGLDPQKSRDFFAHPAHTTVPPPSDPVAKAFFAMLGARHPPYSLNLRSATSQDDPSAVVPTVLTFQPLRHFPEADPRDLRDALADLTPGEKLWEVHAEGVPVGYVQQTSYFVSSSYGDRILHFPHA